MKTELSQWPDISVVIPVYNEEGAITQTLDLIERTVRSIPQYSFELILVDDCSKDHTGAVLRQRAGIILLENPYNLGYGASLKRGIKHARGKWVFITDADGTYPINQLCDFLPYLDSYDMVVGARVNNTELGSSLRLLRVWSKRFLNWLARSLSGFPIADLNSGMRIFRRDLALEFWHLYPQRFSFTSTITMAFIKSNYFVKYVPIEYFQRVGKTSIKASDFFRFLQLIVKIAFLFNPIKVLLPFSMCLLIIGVVKGGYDYLHLNAIGNLSPLLILTALLLFFLSVVADLLFKQRRMV